MEPCPENDCAFQATHEKEISIATVIDIMRLAIPLSDPSANHVSHVPVHIASCVGFSGVSGRGRANDNASATYEAD